VPPAAASRRRNVSDRAGGEELGHRAGPDRQGGAVHGEGRRVILKLRVTEVALRVDRTTDEQGLPSGAPLERDPQAGRGQAGIRLRRFHEAGDAQVGQRGDGLGRGLGVGQRVEGGLEAPFGAGGGHPDARPRLADESEHLVVRSAADGDGACLEIGDLEDLIHAVVLGLGLQRRDHRLGERDDATAICGQQEAFPGVGHQAHLGLGHAARLARHLQRPARLRQPVDREPVAAVLDREALV